MSFKPLAASALLATLAACSAQTPPADTTPPPPTAGVAEGTSCGAEKFADYIGKKATDDVIAAIRARHGDEPMRVLKPGTAVTMDYRAERLNVSVDDAGTITRFACS
ncbi:I78 family peptidase inhibitor [Novosphingobium gossypii]|uniref:I78 family peptidase inhibitor n=1 Tax=Novosphingobium gossypii TaxID=1604774 RepID=UPI003D1AC434